MVTAERYEVSEGSRCIPVQPGVSSAPQPSCARACNRRQRQTSLLHPARVIPGPIGSMLKSGCPKCSLYTKGSPRNAAIGTKCLARDPGPSEQAYRSTPSEARRNESGARAAHSGRTSRENLCGQVNSAGCPGCAGRGPQP